MGLFDSLHEPDSASAELGVGDRVAVEVTSVSEIITGEFGNTFFFIEGTVVEATNGLTPGDETSIFVYHHKANGDEDSRYKQFAKAAAKAGRATGVQPGDIVGVAREEDVTHNAKGKEFPKPFKKLIYVVQASTKPSVFQGDAPF